MPCVPPVTTAFLLSVAFTIRRLFSQLVISVTASNRQHHPSLALTTEDGTSESLGYRGDTDFVNTMARAQPIKRRPVTD
ncbi:hypothetical protein GCM10023319_54070 [Nocardia iowensis]